MEKEKKSEKPLFQIDTFEVLKVLNRSRRFILKFIVIFFFIGIIIAFLSPKEYTATSSFVTQVSSEKKLGKKISGIASLIGVNVGNSDNNLILPVQYPLIIESTPFKKQILASTISVKERKEPVSISYYLSDIKKTSLLGYIKNYTIGLPSKVKKIFSNSEIQESVKVDDSTIYYLNSSERDKIEYLYSNFTVSINDDGGFIEIKATLPEAKISAQFTNSIQVLLQKFIIEYNVKKAKQELNYLTDRFKEAEKDYFNKRAALASYKDRNLNVISNLAQNRLEQLQTEYNLSSNIYSQLAGELESARLNVKRDTPVFTVVKPATIPIDPSAPKRILLIFEFIIFGCISGSLYVLFKYFYQKFKKKIAN